MKTGGYVDGFVLNVPKKGRNAYKKMAELGKRVWMKHGALAYYECLADDLKVQAMEGMKTRSFKEVAKAGNGDEVWFSFIVFKDAKHRKAVNAKVMKDQEMLAMGAEMKEMPVDMRKMAYGGFKVIIGA